MIYFSDASGTLTRCVPEQVYQGSAEGNRLFLVAPFAQNAEVYAAFRLPDGSSTERFRLEHTGLIGGIAGAGGAGVYGWRCALPACVTEQYGSVTVQFFRFVAGEELSVFAAQFTVERGVQPQLPAAPGADVYREIVDALAAIGADLRNGFFAARAIFAWKAAYAYGANEIAYYPTGEHGALVRSLHADNTQPPYTADGALNSAHWAEELNFAAVSEQYLGAVQAEADRAEEAADRAQLLAERLASVLDKDVLLVDELPASPQEDTLYLLAGEGDALFELWIYDGEWVSFGGADIVLNTTGFHSGTLTQGGWSGGRQTVAVADIAAEDAVYAVPEDGYAAAYLAAGIRAAECADGGVVFTCKSPPSQDIRVALAVTKRQDAPRVSVEGYYTKEEADSALSAEASARSQADLALGGRIDSLLSGGTPVARATNADAATTAANATHAASADTATKASQDGNGNDIAATYATKAELSGAGGGNFDGNGTYPNLSVGQATHAASADNAAHADSADTATTATNATHADSADTATTATNAAHADSADTATTAANATHAASADTATKASQDASGNDIAATYATKAELSGAGGGNFDGNGTYPNLSVGQATHATSADNAAHADSADTATTATNATHAASADNAAHADSADTATTATSRRQRRESVAGRQRQRHRGDLRQTERRAAVAAAVAERDDRRWQGDGGRERQRHRRDVRDQGRAGQCGRRLVQCERFLSRPGRGDGELRPAGGPGGLRVVGGERGVCGDRLSGRRGDERRAGQQHRRNVRDEGGTRRRGRIGCIGSRGRIGCIGSRGRIGCLGARGCIGCFGSRGGVRFRARFRRREGFSFRGRGYGGGALAATTCLSAAGRPLSRRLFSAVTRRRSGRRRRCFAISAGRGTASRRGRARCRQPGAAAGRPCTASARTRRSRSRWASFAAARGRNLPRRISRRTG